MINVPDCSEHLRACDVSAGGGHFTVTARYIAPVTLTLLVVAFFVIAFLARRSGFWVAVGSAIVGTIAAPMIFELPFDLIVMWRTYPPAPASLFTLLFFLPLFLVEISQFCAAHVLACHEAVEI